MALLPALLIAMNTLVEAQQPKAGDVKLEAFEFKAANGETVESQMGSLFVPENRGNPNSRLIELAFVRLKSSSKNPGLPIITPVKSGLPVLFISGELDGRTPAGNAEEILRGFPNGRHLTVEAAGHVDASMFIPKTREVMLEFLQGKPVTIKKIPAPPLVFEPLK
jgi:pimeloyl-ACP methyl ester carboxylesterase